MFVYKKGEIEKMKKTISTESVESDFGAFIRDGREAKGMSQREVAPLLDISQGYYGQIELGIRHVDFVMALRICQVLDLDINTFVKKYVK